jgi:hypothetical protein
MDAKKIARGPKRHLFEIEAWKLFTVCQLCHVTSQGFEMTGLSLFSQVKDTDRQTTCLGKAKVVQTADWSFLSRRTYLIVLRET